MSHTLTSSPSFSPVIFTTLFEIRITWGNKIFLFGSGTSNQNSTTIKAAPPRPDWSGCRSDGHDLNIYCVTSEELDSRARRSFSLIFLVLQCAQRHGGVFLKDRLRQYLLPPFACFLFKPITQPKETRYMMFTKFLPQKKFGKFCENS